MLVTFHVWNAVISLSMVELKSMMRDGDWENRGVGNWEWSRVEQNRAEQSRIRIIRIKIKEKCDIITEGMMGSFRSVICLQVLSARPKGGCQRGSWVSSLR